MAYTKEMQAALAADGEKLRQLTGEDHGPAFGLDMDEDCPNCGGEGYVYDCIDGCCEYAEEGCEDCATRCDWCNAKAPAHD